MPCGKEMPQETFLFTLKSPMRFSVSSHGLRRTFHLLDVRYPQVYRTQPLGARWGLDTTSREAVGGRRIGSTKAGKETLKCAKS